MITTVQNRDYKIWDQVVWVINIETTSATPPRYQHAIQGLKFWEIVHNHWRTISRTRVTMLIQYATYCLTSLNRCKGTFVHRTNTKKRVSKKQKDQRTRVTMLIQYATYCLTSLNRCKGTFVHRTNTKKRVSKKQKDQIEKPAKTKTCIRATSRY